MKHLVIALVLFLAAAGIFAQNQNAVIKEITGTVELKAPGQANFRPARVGERVGNTTIISTGFKSTAVIEIGSSTITVRPLTSLSLETILGTNEGPATNLELRTGRVRVDVNPPAGSRANFNVQSPSSTASVRGTNFEMDFMNITVNKGTVVFGSGDQPVLVTAGQSTWVDTVTGKVLNTFDAGELNRDLPALPGQGQVPGSVRPRAEGLFVADIILDSK